MPSTTAEARVEIDAGATLALVELGLSDETGTIVRRWYSPVVRRDVESGHGGDEYEQLFHDGELVLQLHHADVDDHHGPLADPDVPLANGVLVWFEVADFDGAVDRARAAAAPVVRDVEVNPNAHQRELWIRDPDGYTVVLAGPSEYRPRA